jgi:hypothetical protein
MYAATMNALRYAEFAGGFHSVCAGSALQSSKHFASRRAEVRCSIHNVKQRADYTTIGGMRLRCIA